MTFTYTGDLTDPVQRVRFTVQDTVENSGPKPGGGNFQDEEIAALLAENGTWQATAAELFRTLASAWARFADVSAGRVREAASQKSRQYLRLADEYDKRAAVDGGSVYGGGVAGSLFAGIVADDAESDAEMSMLRGAE